MLEWEPAVERVHVGELKVPPLPPSLQETVPDGTEAAPGLVFVIVLVNVMGEKFPIVAEALPGETVVVVARATEKEEPPELAECDVSPE